jgi:cytochrome c553
MPNNAPPSANIKRCRWLSVTVAALVAIAPMSMPSIADDAKLEAYGGHLARECTSCHRIDGIDNGIPSIVGLPPDTFVSTMKFYRDGARTNAVMVSVASSLTDQQLQALAAFFASVPQPSKKAATPSTDKKARK